MIFSEIASKIVCDNKDSYETESVFTANFYGYSNFDFQQIQDLFHIVKNCDKISISFSVANDSYVIKNEEDDEFFLRMCSFYENINLNLNIVKYPLVENDTKIVNVYNTPDFMDYLNKKNEGSLFEFINSQKKEVSYLVYKTLDSKEVLCAKGFMIGTLDYIPNLCVIENKELVLEQCKTNVVDNVNVVADEFSLLKIDSEYSALYIKIKAIRTFLSLMTLMDYSHLKYNIITYTVLGKDDSISLTYQNDVFFNIYKWVYEGTYYLDKLLIAKQILSGTSIEKTDDATFNSMKVNYMLQKKKNISEFFKFKSELTALLLETSSHITNIKHRILDRFVQNFATLIGFIFSIVILNKISATDGSIVIFSSDVMVIINIFSLLSYVYLIVTIKNSVEDLFFVKNNRKVLIDNYYDIFEEDTYSLIHKDNFSDNVEKTIKAIKLCSYCWFFLMFIICFSLNLLYSTIKWWVLIFLWIIGLIYIRCVFPKMEDFFDEKSLQQAR